MTTFERMYAHPNVREVFFKSNRKSFYASILFALFAPIEVGDEYLDGYRDWEKVTATTYFRKDFHSTAYLKLPK